MVAMDDPRVQAAKQLAGGPLGLEIAKTALGYAAPLFWCLKHSVSGLDDEISNGTTFFLDCGRGAFGVTAGHVYDGFAKAAGSGIRCQLGRSHQLFDLRERLISRGIDVDIATYHITVEEIGLTGATVMTGCQAQWPPSPPAVDQWVVYAGYPGVNRKLVRPRHIEFGTCCATGAASSVSDRDISCVLEREYIVPTLGMSLPPLGYDLAGMSGGPMIAILQMGVVSWHLAGVVYECGRELLEVVKAARVDFIDADGLVLA
jgi:hypothetical protein